MEDAGSIYAELTDRIVGWSRARRDVRALAVVGSRAGAGMATDAWSDLDLLLVCRRPGRLASGAWLSEIEEPWLTYPIPSPSGGERARGAVFRDGRATIDFAFLGIPALRAGSALLRLFSRYPEASRRLPPPLAEGLGILARMLRQGTNVLLDKDGGLTRLAARPGRWPIRRHPAPAEFLSAVHSLLGAALWTGKKLRRGDLWRCAVVADRDLKASVLQMVEWHAILCGPDGDTAYLGRDLHAWADPRIVTELPRLFSRYESRELHESLVATLDLYVWIAREVGARLGVSYPEEAHRRVREALEGLRPEALR